MIQTVKTNRHGLAQQDLGRRLKRLMPLYLMLLPAIIYIIIFNYIPMYGAQIAFRDFSITKGIWGSKWVGLKYIQQFFKYYQFWQLIRNTLALSVYSLLAFFAVRIVLSLSINSMLNKRYKKIIQTITYMPYFISTVVMVGIVMRFLNPSMGPLSKLIQALGGTNRDLMGVAGAVPHIYVWSGIWQNAGWGTILLLAALSAVDPQLYEAATIDGASRLRCIWHIDLPTLLPTVIIVLLLNLGDILYVDFEKILLMQNSLNLSVTQVLPTYVYAKGIASSTPDYSYAAAIGLFNSAVGFLLVVTVNAIAKKLNQASLW